MNEPEELGRRIRSAYTFLNVILNQPVDTQFQIALLQEFNETICTLKG